jgi:hypothetical protein
MGITFSNAAKASPNVSTPVGPSTTRVSPGSSDLQSSEQHPNASSSSNERYHTYHLRLIPESTTEAELRKWLEELSGVDDNILALSLVPYTGRKSMVATVTFSYTPELFHQNKHKTEFQHNADLGGKKFRILIDSNIHGITPLYSCDKPCVELVHSLIVSIFEYSDRK